MSCALGWNGLCADQWQREQKHGTAACFVLCPDLSAKDLNNPARRGQPKSRTTSLGSERLEDARKLLSWNACSRIRDGKLCFGLTDLPGFHHNEATARKTTHRRIYRIQR